MCGELFMKIEEVIQNELRNIYKDDKIVFDKSRFAGGLTNYNYIMDIHGTEYVVRQPGGMTDVIIDRKIEKVNNQIASEIGINSECVYFNEDNGIKISKYIENSKNIGQIDPCSPENIVKVSSLIKKTHSSKKAFPNIFDWQKELYKYEEIIIEGNGDLFSDYDRLKKQLVDFTEENIVTVSLVPCHNDTVPENFIVNDRGDAYLIDWEYAGMNDPSWDIASYILESRLNEEAIEFILQDYYGQRPGSEEILKIKCYMVAQDLLWSVWAMIRHYNGDDFLQYCNFRYERFKKNMEKIAESSAYPLSDMVMNI